MDDDIVAVLLIPADGDPGGLTEPGRCGGYPPRCYLRVSGEWAEVRHATHRLPSTACALPLVWDGALVPEGWDRARRVVDSADLPGEAMDYVHEFHPDLAAVVALAGWVETAGFARVVRLARVDGRLVEVE